MNVRVFFAYLSVAIGLCMWWGFAFYSPSSPQNFSEIQTIDKSPLEELPALSHFARKTLHKALSGDFDLMGQLIAEWDLDAQILTSQGFEGVKRISKKKLLRSQLLGRCIKKKKDASRKFLPQTYTSAGILLTILDPNQIVALPKGLRNQKGIYSQTLTSTIPLDADRFKGEKLFQTKPEIAFVSSEYSHPAAIQALINQGIKICPIGSLATLNDIKNCIDRIGKMTDQSSKTELLNLFVEASLNAIENRYKALGKKSFKVLFVSYYDKFYLPSPTTVTYELLNKLSFLNYQMGNVFLLEKLRFVNPDCLIFSTTNPDSLKKQLRINPALASLKAIQRQKIFIVDDDIQQTPTHFVVLAYFDLVDALAKAFF